MLTNITEKSIACSQLYAFEKVRSFAQEHPYAAVPVSGIFSAADIIAETVKYPITTIENTAFSAINALGAYFFKECNLQDASRNIQVAGITTVATPIVLALSLLNILGSFCNNLTDPKKASSCNKEAEEQANLPAITYDSKQRRALREAVEKNNLPEVKSLLTDSRLTNLSVGRALEDAASNGHIDVVKQLLADPRATDQSASRALTKAAEKNYSEIAPLLIARLLTPSLDLGEQTRSASVILKLQARNTFIYQCMDKAEQAARKNGHTPLAEKLASVFDKNKKSLT